MSDGMLDVVDIEKSDDVNIVLGQSHFIKSVEDLYEAMVNAVPQARFGIAFCEASGPCKIRKDGNDDTLIDLAVRNAQRVGAGHTFFVFMRECFPVNVLNAIKQVPEVCQVFCATANPCKVMVAEERFGKDKGRGILGVIDGFVPKGVENADDVKKRTKFLQDIGYKR